MQVEKGDARLLEPVTELVIMCGVRIARTALPATCGLGAVRQWGIVVIYDDVIVGE